MAGDNQSANTCVSPLSVFSALALALPGSNGKTRDELLGALRLSKENDFCSVNAEVGSQLHKVFSQGPDVESVQANGLFLQTGMNVLKAYLDSVQEQHAGSASEV